MLYGTAHWQKKIVKILNDSRMILCKEYEKYQIYEEALSKANLETLEWRREDLYKKCLKNEKAMFPNILKAHKMETREEESVGVQFAHTWRLQKSAIPYMQRLLIKDEKLQPQNRKMKAGNEDNLQKRKRKPG